jgi:hypothetical protein
MSSFYLMPSGKMPMQNGKPVLITQEQFEDCCCSAPCSCPAGLADTYIVLAGAVNQKIPNILFPNGIYVYTLADATVTREGSTCMWVGTVDMNIDGEVYNRPLYVYLDTVGCGWVLVLAGLVGGFKEFGTSPAGAYTDLYFNGIVTEAT